MQEAVQGGAYAASSVLRHFHDQPHGFAAARGDRSEPFVCAAARQANQTAIDFFELHFLSRAPLAQRMAHVRACRRRAAGGDDKRGAAGALGVPSGVRLLACACVAAAAGFMLGRTRRA